MCREKDRVCVVVEKSKQRDWALQGKMDVKKLKCLYVGGGEQVTFCILLIVCWYCTCKLGENNSNSSQRSLYIFHVIKLFKTDTVCKIKDLAIC